MSGSQLHFESSDSEPALEIPDGVSSREMLESMRKNDEALLAFEVAIDKAIALARRRLQQRPEPMPIKAAYRLESHVFDALIDFQEAVDFTCEVGHEVRLSPEERERRTEEMREKLRALRARRKP